MSEGSEAIQRFIESLFALLKTEDRGALAALRRGLGKRPGEAPEMFPYVIPYCAWLSEPRQDDYFLVAALFALMHQGDRGTPDWGDQLASGWHRPNLGASYRALAEKTGSESIERRFVALLNARREDLDDHLRRAVALMKAHDVNVNWSKLLRDLRWWSDDSRRVQREWAQAFWGERQRPDEASQEATTAEVTTE